MSEFFFQYELEEYGWATAVLGNGVDKETSAASYVFDPLRELGLIAVYLFTDPKEGATIPLEKIEATFCGEPAGLIVEVVAPDRRATADTEVTFHVWYCDDLLMYPKKGRILFSGTTTARQFAEAVHREMSKTLDTFGFDGYLERWMEADFPLTEFARIARILGVEELHIPLGKRAGDESQGISSLSN